MTEKKRIVKVTWDGGLQISKGDEIEILRGIVNNESSIRASVIWNITTGREERSNIEGLSMPRNPTDIMPPIKGAVQRIGARSNETIFELVVGVGIIEVGLGRLLKEASKFLDKEIVESCIYKKEAEDVVTSAFRILEERIRAKIKAKPESHGVDLVQEAYHPQKGKLVFGETEAEREGLFHLFRSSILFLRNPPSHRFIREYSEFEIFEMVCLVNLLLKILEKSQIRNGEKKKGNSNFRKSAQKPQKRALKREHDVRIAEEVYGVLFSDIKSIILSLELKWYKYVDFNAWREMQDDHRYFMVDKEFRTKLDRFRERIEGYSKTVNEVRQDILPRIVMEGIKQTIGVNTNKIPSIDARYVKGRGSISTAVNLADCLISGIHPIEYVTKNNRDVSEVIFWLRIQPVGKSSTIKYDNSTEFNHFWQSTRKSLNEDETYRYMIKENDSLLDVAKKLKQEIANRIEEQLKI